MKKFFRSSITVCLLLSLFVLLIGCGKSGDCSHEYDNACDISCNECGETREVEGHQYDNACDTSCNECGETREVEGHQYDNACDTSCNECGEVREVEGHKYDNACDTSCNECGETREVEGHKYDNACDKDCNICFEVREGAGHVYVKANDTVCDTCGATRTLIASGECGTFVSDSVVWGLDQDGTLTISGDGDMNKGSWSKHSTKVKHIVIREGITSIPYEAFWAFNGVTSVSLPETLSYIDDSAFYSCYRLASVYLPDSLEFVGEKAFYNCYSLTSVRLGKNLSYLGEYSFYNCYKLLEVINNSPITDLKSGLTFISSSSKTIHTGESVINKVGDFLFFTYNDINYLIGYIGHDSNVTLPESFNNADYEIHDFAFYFCYTIDSVSIPKCVKHIGKLAFSHCDLSSATFGETFGWWVSTDKTETNGLGVTVSDIYRTADYLSREYANCYWHNGKGGTCGVTGNENSVTWEITPNGTLIISGNGAMADFTLNSDKTTSPWDQYKSEIVKIVIEDGVTNIGAYTAYQYPNLTEIQMGNDVAVIGDYAFNNCKKLPAVTFGNSVTEIGAYAFTGCSLLYSITLVDGITSIGEHAFSTCNRLVEIINHSSLEITLGSSLNGYIGYYAIEVHSGESKITKLGDYLFYTTDDTNYLFGYVGSETELSLPETFNSEKYSIAAYAFENAPITGVNIPANVTSIGTRAFSTRELKNVTFAYGITHIGEEAFFNSGITSITLPDSVTYIEDYAFRKCPSLKYISLGSGVTRVGNDIIYESLYYEESKNWTANVIILNNCLVQTSRNISETYYIPYGTKLIADDAFTRCGALTEIVIPESVKYINSTPFWANDDLKNIIVDENNANYASIDGNLYTKDGKVLIQYASGKSDENFVIPDGVTTIKRVAFSYNNNITSIEIPASVTVIEHRSFNVCEKLTKIINNSSVEITEDHCYPFDQVVIVTNNAN